ncbi:MAG: CAP domain-containing protein [Thermoanaerobaculales bacterium]|jgi:uncharacterized protein YkwD|nr:CAP domain-containing protein [Thermoanaerobaculales bacterium]
MNGHTHPGNAAFVIVMCCVTSLNAADAEVGLGEPVIRYETAAPQSIQSPPEKRAVDVNNWSRSAVAAWYDDEYVATLSVPMQWSGSAATCTAGTTSQAYIDATFQMINYYRGMVGLPEVNNNASLNSDCQEAALMFAVNNALSHSPPSGWTCYTSGGATAAGSSNIALGAAGPGAMSLYMKDPGINNYFVGHRRWLLCPTKGGFGTGSVDSPRTANSLWVFGNAVSRPATPDVVAWPPEGYVPYQVVYDRWSLSLNSSPYANYGSATVTMTENGSPISLSVVSRANNGYCDNTIVWEPSGLSFTPGAADRTITVTVSNIGGSPSSVTYDVVVIDPSLYPEEVFADGFEAGGAGDWDEIAD